MPMSSEGRRACAGTESERWAAGSQRIRDAAKAARIAARRRSAARKKSSRLNGLYYGTHTQITDGTVREALLRNVPADKSQVGDRLARLARDLKAVDPKAKAADHAAVVRHWQGLVAERYGKDIADAAGSHFEQAYMKAHAKPAVAGIVAAARAKLTDRYGEFDPRESYEMRKERVYMALIYLAETLGRRVVSASCRMVAAVTGLSPATSARMLKELVEAGDIKVAIAGQPSPFCRLATVYDLTHQLPELPDKTPAADHVRINTAEVRAECVNTFSSSPDVFGEASRLAAETEWQTWEGTTCVSGMKLTNSAGRAVPPPVPPEDNKPEWCPF